MKLTDLDPQWAIKDGNRIGFSFVSPTNPKWRQSCFVEPVPRREQVKLLPDYTQLCAPGTRWMIEGGIEDADFSTLTVGPSLDGSAGGLWHGFIRNGHLV